MLTYVIYSIIGQNIPLDLYKEINRKRIIGQGRGVASFFLFTTISLITGIITKHPLQAFYLGIGGVIGTYTNSFIKRRICIERGQYIFFLDQTDFIIGASVFYSSQYYLSLNIFFSGIIIALLLHHIVNLLRKNWEKLIKDKEKTY